MTKADPTPELPDDTSIDQVRFPTRIKNALREAGVHTIGQIREASDATLLSFQGFRKESVIYLRITLGLPYSLAGRHAGSNLGQRYHGFAGIICF